MAGKKVCLACALRAQCSMASCGRTLQRHEHQELLDRARAQAHSRAGKQDRRRRQHLMEQSFADAANNHGFKRSRWRRLWRQAIQDYLIAAIQNVRILLRHLGRRGEAQAAIGEPSICFVVDLPVWLMGYLGFSRVVRVYR